jgi:hypothetical protein
MRAMNDAIWARDTVSDGAYVVAVLPVVTPESAKHAMFLS